MRGSVFFLWLVGVLATVPLGSAQTVTCTRASSCPGASPANYTSCCGPSIGCCTPKAYKAFSSTTAGLTGSCLTDVNRLTFSCTRTLVNCLNSGQSATACATVLRSCRSTKPCVSPSYMTCNLSVALLFSSKSLTQRVCVPQSCSASYQLPTVGRDTYSLLCAMFSTSWCPLKDITLMCPGNGKVTCRNTGSVQCSQTSVPGKPVITTGKPAIPSAVSPSPSTNGACTFAGKTYSCPRKSDDPADTKCCGAGGRFLGCCSQDVQSFVDDLFGQFDQTCTNNLTKTQTACYTKLVSCQNKLQEVMKGKSTVSALVSALASGKDGLQSLSDCLLFRDCVNTSLRATSRCPSQNRLCQLRISTASIPGITGLSQSNYLCLPNSCTNAQAQVMALSKTVYTSFCYPLCALTNNFKSFSLPGLTPAMRAAAQLIKRTGCIVKSVAVSCSGGIAHTATYTPSGDECAYPDLGLPFLPSSTSTKKPGGDSTGGGGDDSTGSGGNDSNGGKGSKNGSPEKSKTTHTLAFVIAGVGSVLVVVAIAFSVICYWRRNRTRGQGSSQAYSVLQADET